MSSPPVTTLIQMMESLPHDLQEKVVEHTREYIADLAEEKRWEDSFQRTQDKLIAAAQKAKQEIAAGQAMPMEYEQL